MRRKQGAEVIDCVVPLAFSGGVDGQIGSDGGQSGGPYPVLEDAGPRAFEHCDRLVA